MSEQVAGSGKMIIGGAERPFHVGFKQGAILARLPYYQTENGRPMSLAAYNELFSLSALSRLQFGFDDYGNFIYSALVAGCQLQQVPVDFTPEQVLDWIGEADDTEAAKPFKEMAAQALARAQAQIERAKNDPAPTMTAAPGQAAQN
jgi:hypothetical protein